MEPAEEKPSPHPRTGGLQSWLGQTELRTVERGRSTTANYAVPGEDMPARAEERKVIT